LRKVKREKLKVKVVFKHQDTETQRIIFFVSLYPSRGIKLNAFVVEKALAAMKISKQARCLVCRIV
jgi:hypothetical protein